MREVEHGPPSEEEAKVGITSIFVYLGLLGFCLACWGFLIWLVAVLWDFLTPYIYALLA